MESEQQGETGGAGRGRPLVVTRDGELLDELLRLAAAGGVDVTVAMDAVAAEVDWARAPLVVVGADRAADVARRRLPRRLGVVVVAGRAGDRPWSDAQAVRAEHVLLLPDASAWLVARFAEHGQAGGLPGAPRAAVVAVVAGSLGAAAGEVGLALASTAHRRGLSALVVGGAGLGAPAGSPPGGPGRSGAALEAMAAALQAGLRMRDLVVVDLPYGLDEAALLALTAADRGLLVVVAHVRGCAAATRVAAAVRRHCPGLAVVVRGAGPGGLRPTEVALALDLPLAGVLPPYSPMDPVARAVLEGADGGGGPLGRLCRRVVAELDRSARVVS